ncbi:MAG: hypothetical protein ACE5JR_10075 [Gemmatimonadota bacterium]
MRGRRLIGVAIVVVWVAVLGWHVRREYYRPAAERLAEAARTLPPGVAYYSLFRGRSRAGWGQREMDTLPAGAGFVVRERLDIQLPGLGPVGRTEVRAEAVLDPDLALRSFTHETVTDRERRSLKGVVEGDSVLDVSVERDGSAESLRLSVRGGVSLANVWPLRLAAQGVAEPGDRYEVLLFDPASVSVRRIRLHIVERAPRAYPDSADLDSLSRRWYVAGEDTVSAWRVEQEVAGLRLDTWVDEDGRLLSGEAGALRLERTAFELAFFHRAGEPPAPAESVGRAPDPATREREGEGDRRSGGTVDEAPAEGERGSNRSPGR